MEIVPDWIHIPLPGDHYSPSSGSSYATVIYELTRQHIARGGRARVIVGRGTVDGYPPYAAGEIVQVPYDRYPDRYRRMVDTVTGAAGFGRPMKWRGYAAALQAIPESFDGWILVHGEPAIVAPIKAARPEARIALYCHYELFRWYSGREVRRIQRSTDADISISGHISAYLNKKMDRPISSIQQISNGVDTVGFSPPAEEPTGDPVILFVGRVEPEKGVHLLVAACRRLKDRGVRFRLRVVGGKYLSAGAPKSEYQRQTERAARSLGDQAEFTPFVNRTEIPGVYRQATIFCAPSVWDEPFGLTVAEAMACGLPVVVSRRGALPDVAGDGGVYFDPPDDAALADRLAELLDDEPRRRALSVAARERAMGFGWDAVYAKLASALTAATGANYQ